MPHLTEGELQSYLDGEVSGVARADVEAHLPACADCDGRLAELRAFSEIFAGSVQIVQPRVFPVNAALAEVRARDLRRNRWSRRVFTTPGALAKAALLVLGLTTAASAAVPGSPVRRLVASAWREVAAMWAEPEAPVPASAPVQQPEPEPVADAGSGFAFSPVDGRVQVILDAVASGSRIHVTLVDDVRARVDVTGDGARFRTGPGRLIVTGGSGEVRVYLPRSVRAAVVQANGRTLFTKSGAELKAHSPTAESSPAEYIFESR